MPPRHFKAQPHLIATTSPSILLATHAKPAVHLMLIALLAFLAGCGGAGYTNAPGGGSNLEDPAGGNIVVPDDEGAALYQQHCQACHLPLSEGVKQDRTSEQIKNAIETVPAMGGIILTDAEIDLIAQALSSTSADEPAENQPEASDDDPQIHIDTLALMAQPPLNCTSASCHDATPGSARLNLLTGDFTEFAARLVNQPSSSTRCTEELLIDPLNADNSLLLKLIDPSADNLCIAKMPLGSNGVSPEALSTFREWVDALIAAAAQEPGESPGEGGGGQVVQSSAQSPFILGRKLKYLMHGGALTSSELDMLTGANDTVNPDNLDLLINDWMASDAYQRKISSFMAVALHQTPATEGYTQQLGRLPRDTTIRNNMRANLRESFVRTAMRIINNDESFKQVVTTNEWEVTTAVLTALAFADNDNRNRNDFRDTANFDENPGDFTDWRTVRLQQVSNSPYSGRAFNSTEVANQLRTIPDNGTVQLRAPRIGFFNTLAFNEQWQTNVDNQFRLNTNQSVIAALHMTFESGDPTQPHHLDNLDEAHAPEGSDCLGCHKNLDTMRNVLYMDYDPDNHRARANPESFLPDFAFQGHREEVSTMAEFAAAMANHPRFAMAWTEKLCQWFSSIACDRNSQVMIDLANVFEQSNYSFNTLVSAMAKSSLVTQTTFDEQASLADKIAIPGSRVSIARANHYCEAVYQRLSEIRTLRDLPPVNNNSTTDLCVSANGQVTSAASIIPEDSVARGEIDYVQSSESDLMLAKAYDSFCDRSSNLVVGSNDNTTLRTNNIDNALDDMTQILLGIPSNASHYDTTRNALRNLYDVSIATPACPDNTALLSAANGNPTCGLGLNNGQGLRLVWRTVCQSPDLTGIGL